MKVVIVPKYFVCGIAALFLIMLIGCGDEVVSPISPGSTDSNLILVVSRDERGLVSVSSPDGEIYDLEILQKVLEGKMSVSEIIIHPSSVENVESSQAAPPKNPIIWKYITDVTPVWDGVWVTLGPDAILLGGNWYWAKLFAEWTISEYERQSGKKWPYYKRSLNSVTREIMVHCWNCFLPSWRR